MKRRHRPRPLALIPTTRLSQITGATGDLGNDWLVGGTGRDTQTTGGAGLDILIANTGGDR